LIVEPEIYQRMAEVEDRHWWFVSRRAICESLLDRLNLPPDAAILEAGCGTGGNLEMLARRGQVYATELDDEARRLAQARGPYRIAPGRLPDRIPFDGLSFDLIVMTDVLEHLEDDAGALRALRARLKPGAAIILTVPALQWLWSAHDESHHHRRRYRAPQIRALLSDAGYEILYVSYYNFILFPVIAAARSIQRFLPRNGEGHDLRMPSPAINRMLTALFSGERLLLGRLPLPIGVSIVALARNPAE
jgi:SAM-dependent methyltransferase